MASTQAHHTPRGDPCDCGIPTNRHYPSHAPKATPCTCGAPDENHRAPRNGYYCIGLDGEGLGRNPHRYTLLAFSDASGRSSRFLEAAQGGRLGTADCLDFILTTPNNARLFAYAFHYDLTKILQDCDDRTIYRLFRPELRKRPKSSKGHEPKPVWWEGFSLNLIGRKFVVAKGKRRRVIWDIFAFYQSKFVKALDDWKVLAKPELERMARMKDQRAELDKQAPEDVRDYCLSECASLAVLAQKLINAHEDAGLLLRAYHGAGSTASAMMKLHGIGDLARGTPTPMKHATACAFFGGRFENAWSGVISGPVRGHDISSAYPYQTTQLPCLDCGNWKWVERPDPEQLQTALVNFALSDIGAREPWGPLPFRTDTGSIVFPRAIGDGWVWSPEYVAARRIFPDHVKCKGAWVYRTECQCQPFHWIPQYYRERLRIGKEGAGIVFKLGPNSVYGKVAQSVGDDPPFQCWIWAGLITSGTRAQCLDVLGLHKDRANMLMVATDGIYTREQITLPEPRDTGTMTSHKKPLGGWETKEVPQGMFLARPGIYFPLNPTEDDIASVRARGVGRANLYRHWQAVLDAHARGDSHVTIAKVSRFHGAKSSVRAVKEQGGLFLKYIRADNYGEWSELPVKVGFDARPKRERIEPNGFMPLRTMARKSSEPYDRALLSDEAEAEIASKAILEEQPDADLVDYS